MKFWKEKEPDWRMSSPVFSKHCPVSTSSLCRAASVIIKRTWNKAQGAGCEPYPTLSGQGWPWEALKCIANETHSFPLGKRIETTTMVISSPVNAIFHVCNDQASSGSWLSPPSFLAFLKAVYNWQSFVPHLCLLAVHSLWHSQVESPSRVQIPRRLPQEAQVSNEGPKSAPPIQDPFPSKPYTKSSSPNGISSGISKVPNIEHKQKAAPKWESFFFSNRNLLNRIVNGLTKELSVL